MKRILKRIGLGLAIFLGLLLIAGSYFYWRADHWLEQTLRGQPIPAAAVPPLEAVAVPTDSATIAYGRRRAVTLQCTSCHGEQLQGRETESHIAPNLTDARRHYSDAGLARAIRQAVAHDSTRLMGMVSEQAFYHLNDRDVGALIAYIRSLPYQTDSLPPGRLFLTNIGVAAKVVGGFRHEVFGWTPPGLEYSISPDKKRWSARPADGPVDYGRYLAHTHCGRCHGGDLRGEPGYWQTPDVAAGAAYTPAQFERLMREGVALGGKDIDYMKPTAQQNLSHLTDEEIEAIHAYLKARASGSPAAVDAP